MSSVERRFLKPARTETSGRTLSGYAVLYDQPALLMADVFERIRPGAFTESLASGEDVPLLADHRADALLARTRSGTLRIYEDSRGVRFEADLADTAAGRDVRALVERGDMGGVSFGMIVPRGGDSWQGATREVRTTHLVEISTVSAWPVYGATRDTLALRSRMAQANTSALLRRYADAIVSHTRQ